MARLTRNRQLPAPARSHDALLTDEPISGEDAHGFKAIVYANGRALEEIADGQGVVAALSDDLVYLDEGDIIRIDPHFKQLRVIYRKQSRFNSLLVTERCNSNCLMCSQPPKAKDDGYLVAETLEALRLMHIDTAELGITGGEPTLLGDGLIQIIRTARDWLPRTALHVLSNGRRLAYSRLTRSIAELRHPDLMFGIPLYSDLSAEHDYVVQAEGAFDQTIRGFLNAARFGLRTELRVVIHRETYPRLPELAQFITRNLPFVDQVVWMGLEMMGYVKMNLDALWVDPIDYQPQLREAVGTLADVRIKTMIYNHQLCLLDEALWPWAVKSISDWKNVYMPECDGCTAQERCGGFFASADLRRSSHIRAIK